LQTKNAAILSHRPKTQQSLKDKCGPIVSCKKSQLVSSLPKLPYATDFSQVHHIHHFCLAPSNFHPQYYPADFSRSFLSKLQVEAIAQLPTTKCEFANQIPEGSKWYQKKPKNKNPGYMMELQP
jgi:hypothetical protein